MANKSGANTQFGRVSDASGNSPLGALPADNGLAPLCDPHGRLITVPYSVSSLGTPNYNDSAGVVPWLLVVAGAAKLLQAWGSQASGGLLWLHLFDLAAGAPAGLPLCAPLPVPNNGMWSHSFPHGLSFNNGVLIAYSTSNLGYVAPTIGGWISAQLSNP